MGHAILMERQARVQHTMTLNPHSNMTYMSSHILPAKEVPLPSSMPVSQRSREIHKEMTGRSVKQSSDYNLCSNQPRKPDHNLYGSGPRTVRAPSMTASLLVFCPCFQVNLNQQKQNRLSKSTT
jgi:hypothetical protein